MTSDMTFLIGIGDLPEKSMSNISKLLSKAWEKDLYKISSEQSPIETIGSLSLKSGLVQIIGDVAGLHASGVSWLESIASWKIPVVLFVLSTSSGDIPGIAAAYVALCKQLTVPLIGIVQLGESWKIYDRRLDGLPWCGFIPFDLLNDNPEEKNLYLLEDLVKTLIQQDKYI